MSVTGVLTFVFVLIVLVFFHELGHFLFAKLFRMKVEEFAIGMGNPKLRVYHDGETEYNLRAIPIGGFVRIKGMEIEDAAERRLTGANEQIAEPASANAGFETTNLSTMKEEAAEVDGADADGFNNRPIYQRFWVIFGGPLFSFLFGYLVFCLVGATFGVADNARSTNIIEQVAGGKPAARAGIRAGDRVTAINDQPIATGEEMVDAIRAAPGQPLRITLQNEKKQTRIVTATPDAAP
ncbi:MAG: site-2 protease family protein, partial [Armatimonadetes bacterium]|nr:site-2 protease family protein [Armatimonadota bacterium]